MIKNSRESPEMPGIVPCYVLGIYLGTKVFML